MAIFKPLMKGLIKMQFSIQYNWVAHGFLLMATAWSAVLVYQLNTYRKHADVEIEWLQVKLNETTLEREVFISERDYFRDKYEATKLERSNQVTTNA